MKHLNRLPQQPVACGLVLTAKTTPHARERITFVDHVPWSRTPRGIATLVTGIVVLAALTNIALVIAHV